MRELKQSTAANVMVFMTDSSDHLTGKTGLTLAITASKNGAAFGSISPTVTERGNGWYNVALTTSHTDTLGELAFHITGSSADAADFRCVVKGGIDTYTEQEALRLILAAVLGKLSGAATTTVTVRDTADSKDRAVVTVTSDGNRTAATLDAS